jgi:Fe-S oxidoreductase
MLKEEYPRLFDLSEDGFFRIEWDSREEVFTRSGTGRKEGDSYVKEGRQYLQNIQGKVRDINELLAGFLKFKEPKDDYERLFAASASQGILEADYSGGAEGGEGASEDRRPVVVYHHPCHLNRGQGISAEPEFILGSLPGCRFIKMEDDDLCCGGGGMFTFTEAETSGKIGRKKIEAIAKARPDILSTSCPVCRIQLIDLLGRDYGGRLAMPEDELVSIPVLTTVELLARNIRKIIDSKG